MRVRFSFLPSLLAIASLAALPAVSAAGHDGGARLASARGCKDADRPGLSTARIEASLLCIHNRERRAHRLGRLRRNARLGVAARRHGRDMIRRRYFAHVSPEGKGPAQRVAATGYARSGRCSLGENILFNGPRAPSPRRLMGQWLASPGHRANILRQGWRDIGLAALPGSPFGGPGGVTVVAVFGVRS
jgi:uncharacterized protein YkwD